MAEKTPPKQVVVRFAPSPTGVLHVGSARTALFNFLFAKKLGGRTILRIEDTDKERSKPEYEKDIKEGLSWLGIDFDEEYRQSDRGDVYTKYLEKMIQDGSAYEGEPARTTGIAQSGGENKDGTGKIIRFKNPNTKITFEDKVRGEVTFDTTELGDFVIAKDLNSPLYHLGVVVDDFEMGITHVIRGEDGISNTPRQILIQDAIGAKRPSYAHIPLILAPDKSKLSKRHGAVSVLEYRNSGYLPGALVNFLALIGWNPGDDREIFSMEELAREFTLEKIQKGGAVFNTEKLNWINKQYLASLPQEDLFAGVEANLPEEIKSPPNYSKEILKKILPVIVERISTFSDVAKFAGEGEYDYYFTEPKYDKEQLLWKKAPDAEAAKEHLEFVKNTLEGIAGKFNKETTKEQIWPYAEEKGRGNVLWPMRSALSGRDKSPDPFLLAELLGKKETLKRLSLAIEKLS